MVVAGALTAISGLGSSIGSSLLTLAHRAEGAVSSIVQGLIQLFRNILDWIYALMYRFWEILQTNPWGTMHLLFSFWVMME